ncbi:phosphate ABC transporter permease subunit PstC [Pyrococcus furiosus DSM 3638]|uniref:Phosphate transport system permease protein n=3 Tax=Pyrococcus furiosus TaxID=2261 RepID=A0A5C0XPA6_PYRFU|nr:MULTISPECIES: phosphate ABC transporter permease subunit PstC [Pyrococcus]AFN03801.1 phosphate ABC transporter permease [Pyrococcus furiosus COM1]MDK2870057.1 phosphate transport system permease protein [Pyrococcus sp.]QEK78669.1 phosphate ABC transporter permease subunit PstC [Pyrococcus furiosus DSM 3638]
MKKIDIFKIATYPAVIIVFLLFAGMLFLYFTNALPALHKYGLDLYLKNVWKAAEEPSKEVYGIAAAIWGSIYTSIIAIIIALPLSVAYAIFIVDYAPKKLKNFFTILSDIMAGLPTIIYGIWGAFFLVPFLRDLVMKPLYRYLSFLPFFSYPPVGGYSYFSAGVLLAIMITPFASAIIREAYNMVPLTYKEAIYSLGATRYEATKILLGYIKPAIISGTILAFGRAIGETVAVSLVIGNTFNITLALFAPGYTISSLIANQFGNAFIYEYMTPVLFAAGLTLFVIGLVVNVIGLKILKRWEESVRL